MNRVAKILFLVQVGKDRRKTPLISWLRTFWTSLVAPSTPSPVIYTMTPVLRVRAVHPPRPFNNWIHSEIWATITPRRMVEHRVDPKQCPRPISLAWQSQARTSLPLSKADSVLSPILISWWRDQPCQSLSEPRHRPSPRKWSSHLNHPAKAWPLSKKLERQVSDSNSSWLISNKCRNSLSLQDRSLKVPWRSKLWPIASASGQLWMTQESRHRLSQRTLWTVQLRMNTKRVAWLPQVLKLLQVWAALSLLKSSGQLSLLQSLAKDSRQVNVTVCGCSILGNPVSRVAVKAVEYQALCKVWANQESLKYLL